MKRKIVWLVVSCLMVAALVLASCAPAVVEEEEEKEGEEVVEEEVAPVVKEPQYGGTLTVVRYTEPMTWDPANIDWQHNDIAAPYAETLLVGDLQKGPRGTNEWAFHAQSFVPPHIQKGQLVESWEFTDSKTLTFKVRQGVYWQDKPGVMDARELTADDLVYHFTRQLEAPKEYLLKPFVDHFSAPDKYTFVVHLKGFHANWAYRLGWGYFCVVASTPEFVAAGPADWRNAVGTGPFMLADYVAGSSVTYEKNPNYWGTTVINGKEYKVPFVDKLVRPIILDESTRLAALRTAKVDYDYAVSWKYKESLEETNPELNRFRWLSSSPLSLALRVDTPPLDDQSVRYALSMAIDREAMNEALLGGEGEMLEFPFASYWGEQYYTPIEKLPEATQEQFEYNPERAKQFLTEAGYPDGFKLEIVYTSTGTTSGDYCSMIADFWSKIGVEAELKPLEYAAYYGTMVARRYKDAYLLTKDPGNPLSTMRGLGGTGERWNVSMHTDAWFDETLTNVFSETDDTKVAEITKEMNVYLLGTCSTIQLPTGYVYMYSWPWVKNWYGEVFVAAYTGSPIYASIWIDQDLREEMTGRR